MSLSQRQTVVFALSLVLSAVLLYRISPYLQVYKVEVGDRAPASQLEDLGVGLDAYRGKHVLLNLWATWCPPCVEETPSLNRLYQELSSEGLIVLGVSVDADPQAYQQFIDRFGVEFPTARDPQMTVAARYGTNKYPESYLIDPEGYVIKKYVGPEDWMRPEVLNYLRSLL